MNKILLFCFLAISMPGIGQFYYNDIVATRTLGETMKIYQEQKVKTVTATGFDPRGAKNTDFNEWQETDLQNNLLRITTRNGYAINRQRYQFNNDLRLQQQTDSSRGLVTTIDYQYDAKGNLVLVRSVTKDSLNDFNETDEHQWQYDASGNPVKLWRIVNGKDSSEYRFKTDENGKVTDEILYRYGLPNDPLYYYYNDNDQLTDMVRYNKQVRRLMPDFMFEYDDAGRVIQKIATLSITSSQYVIWRYLFNDKGLKTREALFNKEKQMTGKIEYAYSFYE